ncbi:Or13a.2 family protein [Megaselia abdita]
MNAIAKKHQKLIEFCDLLDNFHSPVFFLNFVFSTLLLCMVGFQSVTGKNMFMGDYFKYALYGSSLLTQLLVLCWNGDKIIQLSSETATALYSSNWESDVYDKEHKTLTNDLRFMILRSQKPIRITASKFSVLSCQTFTKVSLTLLILPT